MKLHDTIRKILETTPGLTQKGLAERMGLNPAAVNRMLYGRRNIMVDEIPVIEKYLGVKLEIGGYDQPLEQLRPVRGVSDVPPARLQLTPQGQEMLVPVYPLFSIGTRPVDWVLRHPAQISIDDAFAVYVASDDMEPRYFRGELLYLHPGRPVEDNRDALIVLETGEALIRRVTAQTAEHVTVQQYHPEKTTTHRRDALRAIYSVIGRG